jgi:phosphatidylserine synthase
MAPAADRPSILSFTRDAANVCTLAGLVCGVAGIFFGARGHVSPAMAAMLAAFFFDAIDGVVARRLKGRSPVHQSYGVQLDSLVDVVCACVCPGVLLLGLADFHGAALAVAVLLALAGALRLAYFNVFGLADEERFVGLPVDKNILSLGLVGLAQPLVSAQHFRLVFGGAMVLLAALNVSPLRVPKQKGNAWFAMIALALGMGAVYLWRAAAAA